MFGDQVPNNTAAPVDVTLPMGSKTAPYQVTGAPPDGPAITINRNDGITTNYNNDGTITTGPPDNQQPVNAIGGGGAPGVPVWG